MITKFQTTWYYVYTMRQFKTNLRDILARLDLDIKYIISGGFWLNTGQVFTLLITLTLAYVFANYVDSAEYGFYKYVLSLSAIFSIFSLTGMGQSIIQAAASGYTSFLHKGFKLSLTYGLTVAIIGFSASVYYWANGNTAIAIGCLLIALFQPMINSGKLIFAYFQGTKQFMQSTQLQIIQSFFVTIIIITTIFLTQNILYILAAYFVSSSFILLIFVILYRKKIPPEHAEKTLYDKYLSYAKHTSFRNAITNLSFEIDKIVTFQYLGATELAIYTFAVALPEQLKGVIKNLAVMILIKFTGHSIEDIKKNMKKKVLLLMIVLIFLTTLYVSLAPYIYKLLFPDYSESILLSQLFALSFPSMILILPVSALKAKMAEKSLHTLNYSISLLLVISVSIGVVTFGLIGLILARVLVRYVNAILAFVLLYKNTT